MRQVWLRPNYRVIGFAMILPLLGLLGGGLLAATIPARGAGWVAHLLAWPLLLVSATGLLALLWLLVTPRLAYRDGSLLVYLTGGAPYRIPIDVVEVFFLGHAPSLLPTREAKVQSNARTIVVRIAEAAHQWHQRDVRPMLGRWCDGYIIVRGTWCEPITGELVQRLNAQLLAVHRQRRAARQKESA